MGTAHWRHNQFAFNPILFISGHHRASLGHNISQSLNQRIVCIGQQAAVGPRSLALLASLTFQIPHWAIGFPHRAKGHNFSKAKQLFVGIPGFHWGLTFQKGSRAQAQIFGTTVFRFQFLGTHTRGPIFPNERVFPFGGNGPFWDGPHPLGRPSQAVQANAQGKAPYLNGVFPGRPICIPGHWGRLLGWGHTLLSSGRLRASHGGHPSSALGPVRGAKRSGAGDNSPVVPASPTGGPRA